MNVNAKSPLRRALAGLLCVAMLMSIVVVPVGATEPADDGGIINFITSGDAEQLAPETDETAAPTETTVMTASDENVELLADTAQPQVVQGADNINATIKMFNYDGNINKVGLGPKGYTFFNGNYEDKTKPGTTAGTTVDGRDNINDIDNTDNISGSVDGMGSSSSTWDTTNNKSVSTYDVKYEVESGVEVNLANQINKPTMEKVLNDDDYPQAKGSYEYSYTVDGTSKKTTIAYDQSFDYLFGETYKDASGNVVENPYYKGTMDNGGGLFRYGNPTDSEELEELKGYYYYDSKINAAYYSESDNKFTLYDTVIRPRYIADTASVVQRSNFLPFNPLYDADGNCLIAMDESDKTVSSAEQSGALENYVDLFFGMTVEFDFYMPKDGKMGIDKNGDGTIASDELVDMTFDFFGDDDVYVYIDDVLVLNINGTHAAESGTINFNTGAWSVTRSTAADSTSGNLKDLFTAAGVTDMQFDGNTFADYTKHTLKFYYMERGGNISYCRLRFNMPTLPNESLTVGKMLAADGTGAEGEEAEFVQNSLGYQFRVWKADEDGNRLDELFINEGDIYTLIESGTEVGTRTVGEGGIFTLKDGQQALFDHMLAKGDSHVNYVVEEILPKELEGQYGSVQYVVDGKPTGITKTEGGDESTFSSFFSGKLSAEESELVQFNNLVTINNLGTLKITKTGADNVDKTKAFNIQVKLGGELLPVGTAYTIGGTAKTVTTAGIIPLKVGETAILENKILSGTEFEVTEVLTTGENFAVTYTGTITDKDQNSTALTPDGGISGTFGLNNTVDITVHNENVPVVVEIPLEKTASGNTQSASFSFVADQITGKENETVLASNVGTTKIDVTNDAATSGNIRLAYDENTTIGTYYYKVYETSGTGDYIYDTNYYIVEVTIAYDNAQALSGSVTGIWMKGTGDKLTTASFVNQKLTSVVVKKEVQGVATESAFTFKAIFGETTEEFDLNDGGTYTIENIPVGSGVEITETGANGYTAYYKVGSNGTLTAGVTATIASAPDSTTYVYFTNTKYTVDDTVVIDYGLPVDVNVLSNDLFTGDVTVGMANGTGRYGTAAANADNTVRYTPSNMEMNDADVVTYQVKHTTISSQEGTETGTLTVIPATTIYYEDSFIALTSYSSTDGKTYNPDNPSKWTVAGETVSDATQDEDRPGEASDALENIDADNVYGYDSAYEECSEYSLGSAAKIDVTEFVRGEATFTFYGTGFDVIGLTSNTTGTLTVQIYQGSEVAEEAFKTSIVDTYYGYVYDAETDTWSESSSTDPNALYQIPVMKISDLSYGQYTVKITAGYNNFFDHTAADGYTLYLDAIRVYDPANDGKDNATIENAYKADGEGWPEYFELRNLLINAEDFNAAEDDATVPGIVFIDGKGAIENTKQGVSDYTNYGPNNEVYLTNGQAIAFDMKFVCTAHDKIHLAVKSAQGDPVASIYDADDKTNSVVVDVNTATDLYYDITGLNEKTVVITNTGKGILSITNIKVTHTAECSSCLNGETEQVAFTITRSSAAVAAASLSETEEPVEPETPVEPEVPEEPETPVEPEVPQESETPVEPEFPEEPEVEETVPETAPTEPDEEESDVTDSVMSALSDFFNRFSELFGKWFR